MTEEQQRRRQQRYPVDIPVEMTVRGHKIKGTARNMSVGGMFIETDSTLAMGDEILLEFTVPSPRQLVAVKSQVRWLEKTKDDNAGTGVGVLFLALRAKYVWALNKFFNELQIKTQALP